MSVATIDERSTRAVPDLLHLATPLRPRWAFAGEELVVTTTDDDALREAASVLIATAVLLVSRS